MGCEGYYVFSTSRCPVVPCRVPTCYFFASHEYWTGFDESGGGNHYHQQIQSAYYYTTTEPSYLYKFVSVQPPRNTRSSSSVTISRPSSSSYLKITNRSIISFSISPSLESASWLISSVISLLYIHRISFMTVHVHHHHFYPLNSFSFSLSAENLSFSQVFPTIDFWYLTPGLPSLT